MVVFIQKQGDETTDLLVKLLEFLQLRFRV